MGIPEEHFEKLYEILESVAPKRGKMGRPRRDDREVLAGVLWVLKTGARWCDMPKEYPPYQTCHRRFQEWVQGGVFQSMLAYKVERLFAWMQHFRRVLIRWDYYPQNYLGFIQIAAAIILVRQIAYF